MPLDDDPQEWDDEIREAVTAAVGPMIFTESGRRRVRKQLREKSGRFLKRRSKTPIHGVTWNEERAEKIPVPVYDLTRTPLSGLPPDVYEKLDELVGDDTKPPGWMQSTIDTIKRVRGKPDARVVVHTAVPPEEKMLRPKDWVSLAPGFARTRAEAYPRWHVITATVPASEVLTRSDDLLRWTWDGDEPVPHGGASVGRNVRGRR
jgi:hypothetical protein